MRSLSSPCRSACLGLAALAFGVVLGVAPAQAAEPQYRIFTLSDGRILNAQVLATEASGMRIALPQGESEIPFILLVDMVPIDGARYDAQEPWVVWLVAPEGERERLEAVLGAIPGVAIHGAPGVRNALSAATASEAETCGDDVDCIARVTKKSPWMWILEARATGDQITLRGLVSTGSTEHTATYAANDVRGMQRGAYEALQLRPVGEYPPLPGALFAAASKGQDPNVKAPKDPKEPKVKEPRVTGDSPPGLAFVPVPGFPALAQGDYAGFGLAMGVVLPASAAWFGASGKTAQSMPEHLALGVGGYYVLSVAMNHALAGRGVAAGDVAVGVGTTDAGGTSVVLSGRLK